MNALGIALVWCVIQVSLLSGVVVVLYAATRRSGPSARALAAFAGLVLIVVLSALMFSPWPRWQSRADVAGDSVNVSEQGERRGQAGETASATADVTNETDTEHADKATGTAKRKAELPSPAAAFFQAFVSEIQRLPAPVTNDSWHWQAYVAVLFLIGAGAGLIRLVAGLAVVRSYRLRARPIANAALCEMADVLLAELQAPRRVVLCESERLTTPATIGWRRPLIILPTDWKAWTDEECKTVLAHEIAHIVRNDFATLIAAQLAVVLHFYHPLVHWLAARLRLEQELAADAAAARLTGGQLSYLKTLAGMALRQSDRPVAWPARTFLPTRGTFMRRIEMLRDETSVSRKMSPGVRPAIVVVMLTAALGVAGLRGIPGNRAIAAGDDAPAAAPAAGKASGSTRISLSEPRKTNSPGATTGISSSSSGSGTSTSSTSADGTSSTSATSVEPFTLAYVPRDAVIVAAVRPAELLNRPALAVVKNALAQNPDLQKSIGVSPERIEQLIGVFVMDLPGHGGQASPEPAGVIVHLAAAPDAVAMIKALQPEPEEQEYGGLKYVRGKSGVGSFCLVADERTIVICNREDHMRRLIVAGKAGASKAKWIDTWKGGAHADAAVILNMAGPSEMLNEALKAPGPDPAGAKLGAFSPLWTGTTAGLLTANLHENLKLVLLLKAKSVDDATKVKATLEAALTLGQNSLSQARSALSRQPDNNGAFFLGLIDTVDSLIDSIKITRVDNASTHDVVASAEMDLNEAPKLSIMMLPAIANARQAATRQQSMNNLKQLALAMYNYQEANKSFPPAVLYGPDGKTPYSWRVALLPYLDQAALYEQYNKNEPWDSPANKLVLAKMPVLFRDTGDPADSTFSSYYVLAGPSTPFFGKEGCQIAQLTDGTSNTLLIVEAKRDIPWTKPEDIPYAADVARADAPTRAVSRYAVDAPLPKLGGHHPDIFLAAFCDGAVRAVSLQADPMQLRNLMTRDGGEPIVWEMLEKNGTIPRPAVPKK